MLCVLIYVGAFEKTKENSEYNTKRYEYFYRKNGRDHKLNPLHPRISKHILLTVL